MLSVQWLKLEEENRIRCCDEKNWVLTQNIVEKRLYHFHTIITKFFSYSEVKYNNSFLKKMYKLKNIIHFLMYPCTTITSILIL
mgnify:CR=1 FL=1